MAERRIPREMSSDPGELVRVYQDYVEALERQLFILLYGAIPDRLQ